MSDSARPDLPNIDLLWEWENAALSEQRFRALLPGARASGDTAYQAELLSQLARAEGRQHRFDHAHGTLDQAESLLPQGPSRARVRCLLERGRVFNSSGNPEPARPLFLDAWNMANQLEEEALALDAAHMLGIVEPPDRALDWSHQAITLAEASRKEEVRRWLGPLYNNSGWTYYGQGNYPTALELLTRAQSFYETHGTPTQVRIARYSVGKTLRALGRVEEALEIQQALAAQLEAAQGEDGYIDEELGECLLALARPAEAQPHFRRAYALLSQDNWLTENEPARLERLRQLAA